MWARACGGAAADSARPRRQPPPASLHHHHSPAVAQDGALDVQAGAHGGEVERKRGGAGLGERGGGGVGHAVHGWTEAHQARPWRGARAAAGRRRADRRRRPGGGRPGARARGRERATAPPRPTRGRPHAAPVPVGRRGARWEGGRAGGCDARADPARPRGWRAGRSPGRRRDAREDGAVQTPRAGGRTHLGSGCGTGSRRARRLPHPSTTRSLLTHSLSTIPSLPIFLSIALPPAAVQEGARAQEEAKDRGGRERCLPHIAQLG